MLVSQYMRACLGSFLLHLSVVAISHDLSVPKCSFGVKKIYSGCFSPTAQHSEKFLVTLEPS